METPGETLPVRLLLPDDVVSIPGWLFRSVDAAPLVSLDIDRPLDLSRPGAVLVLMEDPPSALGLNPVLSPVKPGDWLVLDGIVPYFSAEFWTRRVEHLRVGPG